MFGKKKISPVLLVPVALLAAGLYQLLRGGYTWDEHYRPDKKDPYGLSLLESLLAEQYPGPRFETITRHLANTSGEEALYLYVGPQFPLDMDQTAEWLSFIRAGNQAFLACNRLPAFLLDSLLPPQPDDSAAWEAPHPFADVLATDFSLTGDTVRLNFLHPDMARADSWAFDFRYQGTSMEYAWKILPERPVGAGGAALLPLGTLQRVHTNFGRIACGKGVVYLHSTPLAFTNLHLKTSEGLAYAERVFSHFPADRIYWERRRPSAQSARDGDPPQEKTPLRYVLSKPALAWAWYILAGLALLFLSFRAKRRQRIVPVLERPENSSLAFIRTIGRLSFLQGNHRQLARQQMKLFLAFVRDKYGLSTRDLDDNFVRTLGERSGIPETTIRQILTLHRNISASGFVSAQVLTDFHALLMRFRENCS